MSEQPVATPGQAGKTTNSGWDRHSDHALSAIAEAENEAPDRDDFSLRVAVPTGDLAIRAQNLGVRYNLNFTKKTKLRTTFAHLLDPRRRNAGHFWAIRGVDFEVRRGEAVGIVGANGSGKSTMLLALAGILQPTEGVVEVNGHVSTLLSLNAGFDSELTGRDNIALAGALMGIDEHVMEEITPGIIQFANIGAFIDAPMKTYSSGMRARVGFSVATAVDPDILLLDEVLQTGDNTFKQKSRKRIAEVLQTAKAVVMVTHDMSWITAFCTRAILMDKGQIVADGDPEEIADMHENDAEKRKKQKRKTKFLLKHGKVDQSVVRQARKDGTLDDVLDGHEDQVEEIKAQKAKEVADARAAKRAARKARKAAQAAQAAQAAAGARDDGRPAAAGDASTAGDQSAAAAPGGGEVVAAARPEADENGDAVPSGAADSTTRSV